MPKSANTLPRDIAGSDLAAGNNMTLSKKRDHDLYPQRNRPALRTQNTDTELNLDHPPEKGKERGTTHRRGAASTASSNRTQTAALYRHSMVQK